MWRRKRTYDHGNENSQASRLTIHSSRQLDDAELDSGDDEGRDDRAQQDDEEQQQQFEDHEMLSMDVEVARQPVPEPSDGEVGVLNRSSSDHTDTSRCTFSRFPNSCPLSPSRGRSQRSSPRRPITILGSLRLRHSLLSTLLLPQCDGGTRPPTIPYYSRMRASTGGQMAH